MSLERFRKVYSLLPESEKKMIVIVIGEGETARKITWEEAYKEIKDDSKFGAVLQKVLEELDLI